VQTRIAGRTFEVEVEWSGRPLNDPFFPWLAFDTETDAQTQRLALAGASSVRHALLYPEQVPALIGAHPGAVWVMHNAAFDWWVVADYLTANGFTAALDQWKAALMQGRVRDSMLLDMLVRLAEGTTGQESIPPRSLEKLAREFTTLEKRGDDPYRLRYGEVVGRAFASVDPGFLHYASHDPVVTLRAYLHLHDRAVALMQMHGFSPRRRRGRPSDISPDALRRWGPLSEVIQVQGAVALRAVERLGIGVDRERMEATEARLKEELAAIEADLIEHHPDVLPPAKGGRKPDLFGNPAVLPRCPATGCLSLRGLAAKLERVAAELGLDAVPKSQGKLGGISKSAPDWEANAGRHPFLKTWCRMVELATLMKFVSQMRGKDRVHPRYDLLKKTGRTGASNPSIQNQPKGDWRKHFVPAKGYRLFVGDLAGAELATFAAFARQAYGFSKMGDALEAGRNVHGFFAAKILGVEYEDFMALKKSDPQTFAAKRQLAKPANFGLMGGMGAESFVAYASQPAYRVTLTVAEAHRLIELWEDTFPEGKVHRGRTPDARCIARNLGCEAHEVEAWLSGHDPWYLRVVERVVGGQGRAAGGEYNPRLSREVWGDLLALCRRPELAERLARRKGCEALRREVFRRDAGILTGRIAGDVTYTALRNYPFQGLAGDIKHSIARLVVEDGRRVVAFVHDELLVEVGGQAEGAAVARTVEEGMNAVMGQRLAVVEWHLADCWVKP
jgi:hypothetical protein